MQQCCSSPEVWTTIQLNACTDTHGLKDAECQTPLLEFILKLWPRRRLLVFRFFYASTFSHLSEFVNSSKKAASSLAVDLTCPTQNNVEMN